MVLGHYGHPGLPPDREAVQLFGVIGSGHQRKIRQSPLHPLHDLITAAVPEVDGHTRELGTEAGNPASQQIRRAAFHQADVQIAGEPFHGQLQDLTRAAVQMHARVRDCQMPLAPDEKLHAQLFLQALDLGGERRLTHVQSLTRPCDIEFLCHNDEVVQRAQIHFISLFLLGIRKVYTKQLFPSSVKRRFFHSWRALWRRDRPPCSPPIPGSASRSL